MVHVTTSGTASTSFLFSVNTLPDVVATSFSLFSTDGVLPTDDDAMLYFFGIVGIYAPVPLKKSIEQKSFASSLDNL